MPAWLQPRIKCFYCGRASKHRKSDNIRDFQCSSCEGTNYLDEHGNITDVPAQALESSSHTERRYAVPVQRPSDRDVGDGTFCSQCIKNQRIVSDCLANYLPSESHPHYQQFMVEFDKYKQDLERRYPQVCPRCEAKVRDRLKKNTYTAQSDSFNKTLARSAHLHSTGAMVNFMSLTEAAWWINLLVQGTWHLLGALGSSNLTRETTYSKDYNQAEGLGTCLSALSQTGALGYECTAGFTQIVRFSFYVSVILLWWNPAIMNVNGRILVRKTSFYSFQATMLFVRWFSWYCIKDGAGTLSRHATRGIQLVVVLLTIFTLSTSYRMVGQAPRPKIARRDLNTPLVDENSFQYPTNDFISQASPSPPSKPRFDIRGLKAVNASPIPSTSGPALVLSPFQPPESKSRDASSDAMDWEPAPPRISQPSYNLRPRSLGTTPQPLQPQYPTTSAFGAFPAPSGPSPFHGSLPAAPKSVEARLRGSARQPAPQFKPASDAKQADWFKRMGLTQSTGSWAGRDYVSSVKKADDMPEFAPGKLSLDGLGGKKIDGTGLEDMFQTSFKLDDRGESPEKESQPPVQEKAASESLMVLAGMCGIALILVLLSQFAPELWQRLLLAKDEWLSKAKQLAYGQGLGGEPGVVQH